MILDLHKKNLCIMREDAAAMYVHFSIAQNGCEGGRLNNLARYSSPKHQKLYPFKCHVSTTEDYFLLHAYEQGETEAEAVLNSPTGNPAIDMRNRIRIRARFSPEPDPIVPAPRFLMPKTSCCGCGCAASSTRACG